MQTRTIQKRARKIGKTRLKKIEPGGNDEKNRENEDKGTKCKPMKLDEATEHTRKILASDIDSYDAFLTWWETNHVRYAITYPPVKSRLEKLMGSYVVRLTDYKYMQKLAFNLYKDHVEQQRIRIEKRKLAPPSIIDRLLKISYKALSKQIQDYKCNKIKLHI